MEKYDFVIAGGGAAGLTLARDLVHGSLGHSSILIVDRDAKERNDRTWCFWTDHPTPFDGIVHRSWDRLRVATDGLERTISLEPYRYRMIRGIDFYRFVREDLSARPNVQFLRGTVERIQDGADGASAWVEGREYRGRWVFDGLFDLSQLGAPRSGYHRLLQHFKGWEIETGEDRFDPTAATFLDFRTPQQGQARFFYVLPLSGRRALAEYVACTSVSLLPGEAEQAFKEYVGNILRIGDYRVLAREGGVSPMTDQPFSRRIGRSVLAIGTRGGRIKPSTGFAFSRIMRDSAAIVSSLSRTGHPFELPLESRRYRMYDSLMLQIMSRHGERVKPLFASLFQNNPVQRVLRFLDETGSPWENLLLMASLPDPIFLRALASVMVSRATRQRAGLGTWQRSGYKPL